MRIGGSDSFALHARDGRRHPDFLEGGALRGASSERRSWSVRKRKAASSAVCERADDSGCPKAAEEGNDVGLRPQCVGARRRHERSLHALGDASFTRSFDPCTSILTTHRRSNPRWWGIRGGITVGQTCASGRNQHWGHHEWTERGSPHGTVPQGTAWRERKGWRSRPPSLRGLKEPGFGCPHVES